MNQRDKLPLLQKSFRLLVEQLNERDSVAIVTYAGRASVALQPTSGNQTATILQAIDRLSAGGSTAGADGIQTAYRIAQQQFLQDGQNRVILATDGDFNDFRPQPA